MLVFVTGEGMHALERDAEPAVYVT
jgi:hypothetical protein